MENRFDHGARPGQLDADDRVRPARTARSLPIRGSVERVLGTWEARAEDILDGIPAASGKLKPGIDQGRWGTTFTLILEFDAPPPSGDVGMLTTKALRRLKSLVEAGVPPMGVRQRWERRAPEGYLTPSC